LLRVHSLSSNAYLFSCYLAADNFFWLHYSDSTHYVTFYNPRFWYILVLLNIFIYWCLIRRFSSVDLQGNKRGLWSNDIMVNCTVILLQMLTQSCSNTSKWLHKIKCSRNTEVLSHIM
jgi:hypothetical protein